MFSHQWDHINDTTRAIYTSCNTTLIGRRRARLGFGERFLHLRQQETSLSFLSYVVVLVYGPNPADVVVQVLQLQDDPC